MNERIRQLAEECGLLYRQLGPSVETRYMKKKEETIAAFAQLIVQECMCISDSIGEHGYIAAEEMGKHFFGEEE